MTRCALALAACLAASGALAAPDDCPTTASLELYPTGKVLPENTLRMYVYFPRPMAPGQGLENVQLLDGDGASVTGAFLANRENLWSPDRRRLTVLFDPGRVKSGLAAHEANGRALVPGEHYTIVVSGEASDANGCSLGTDGRFDFTIEDADLEIPAPADWSLNAVQVASVDSLVVDLGSAHDHLSLAFQLRVVDAEGEPVRGAIDLGEGESRWIFTPTLPWQDERYAVRVSETLEDLAGNRPGVLFDRPLDQAPVPWLDRLWFTPGQEKIR